MNLKLFSLYFQIFRKSKTIFSFNSKHDEGDKIYNLYPGYFCRSVRNSIHVNLCLSLLLAHTLTLTAIQVSTCFIRSARVNSGQYLKLARVFFGLARVFFRLARIFSGQHVFSSGQHVFLQVSTCFLQVSTCFLQVSTCFFRLARVFFRLARVFFRLARVLFRSPHVPQVSPCFLHVKTCFYFQNRITHVFYV